MNHYRLLIVVKTLIQFIAVLEYGLHAKKHLWSSTEIGLVPAIIP